MKQSTLTKLASALLLAAALSGTVANATPIVGSISFNGNATTNTGNLATATAFTAITDVTVNTSPGGPSGSYIAVPTLAGDSVTFTPFAFSAVGITPLWTLTANGVTYSFDATGPISVALQTSSFLDLQGTGIASISAGGYTDTTGTWTIQESVSGTSFSWGSTAAVAPTPDSSSTALLVAIGLGAIGLGAIAHRRNQVKA